MLRLASVLTVIACVAGTAMAQPPAPAKVLAPKHIPPGFALALTADPNRLHKAAKSVGLPADEWRKQIRASTGVDPADLERVTLLHEPLLNWSVLGMAAALQYPKNGKGSGRSRRPDPFVGSLRPRASSLDAGGSARRCLRS